MIRLISSLFLRSRRAGSNRGPLHYEQSKPTPLTSPSAQQTRADSVLVGSYEFGTFPGLSGPFGTRDTPRVPLHRAHRHATERATDIRIADATVALALRHHARVDPFTTHEEVTA